MQLTGNTRRWYIYTDYFGNVERKGLPSMIQPTLKKKILTILCVFLVYTIAIILVIFTKARVLDLQFHAPREDYTDISIHYEQEGIVEQLSLVQEGEVIKARLQPVADGPAGSTLVSIYCHHADYDTQDSFSLGVTVTKHGLIYSSTYSFYGIRVVFGLLSFFFLTLALILFRWHRKAKKARHFSYQSIQDLGLSVFFLMLGLIHLALVITDMVRTDPLKGENFLTITSLALTLICLLSFPVLLVFSLLITISNIGLIRKEGARPQNALGILLSALLMGGLLVLLILFFTTPGFFSMDLKDSALVTLRAILASLLFYFVCNLFSTLLHCQLAGRHTPAYEQDYILILGCGIREDGTLYPLLQGRADRAIAFYRKQMELNGRKAILVPSGGQGPDECMPEGQAIRNYLISQGIPESDILAETESVNTLQNMQFSKALIEKEGGGFASTPNIAFSTTNFHVFRSGILASDAGMNADGMGAKTKWYFWPNALIREFIGMLARHWKLHAVVLAWILLYAVVSGNIQWLFHLL